MLLLLMRNQLFKISISLSILYKPVGILISLSTFSIFKNQLVMKYLAMNKILILILIHPLYFQNYIYILIFHQILL